VEEDKKGGKGKKGKGGGGGFYKKKWIGFWLSCLGCWAS
jgi:hypothetical protein